MSSAELVEQSATAQEGRGARRSERLLMSPRDDWERVAASSPVGWSGCAGQLRGISPRGTVESTDEALWERTLGVNPKGAWLGIKATLPSLRSRRGRS
jgi:3-oxoacyl-[acyl-carrier protein] reductase